MRKDEFVMRGQTPSTNNNNTEVLNFSGFKPGYAYKLVEFDIYPSTNIGGYGGVCEIAATLTASKSAADPLNPNFNDEGLIATALYFMHSNSPNNGSTESKTVINDTFLITQNLILMVEDAGGNDIAVNWQCKFKPVKMGKAQEAVTNYKQFTISDD